MEKLDRLVWAAGFAFTSYGVRVGVRLSDEAPLGELRSCLPAGWTSLARPTVEHLYSVVVGGEGARPGIRRFHLLYTGAGRLARTHDWSTVVDLFESELRLRVAALATDRVFVHAGVVAWRGRALVICGPSHAGKSELVAELVRAGATYYSDEYAVLDARGRVYPFPKPLSLRRETGNLRYTPEELGGRQGTAPVPVGLVVAADYEAGAVWRPRTLTPGQGLLAMLRNAVAARIAPRRVVPVLRRMAASAPVLAGKRGEAREMAGDLLARLDGARRPNRARSTASIE